MVVLLGWSPGTEGSGPGQMQTVAHDGCELLMSSHMEEETKGDWAVRLRARVSRDVVQAEPRPSRGKVMKRSPPNTRPNVRDQEVSEGRLGYV